MFDAEEEIAVGYAIATALLLAMQSTNAGVSALSSTSPEVRVAELIALRKLEGTHPELLQPVANALTDDVTEVRTEAAYTLAQLAVRLGCKPMDFAACKVFGPLFDSTPVPEPKLLLRYPEAAKQSRVQGSVFVQFLVLEDGSVSELTLIKGTRVLADPVLKALQAQRYRPAKRNGRPVRFTYVFEASFRLT